MSSHSEPIVLVTGGSGMLGSSLLRFFAQQGVSVHAPSSSELDLRVESEVFDYICRHKIDTIIHCAALVGGIAANISRPADFILTNLLLDSSLLSAARKSKIKSLIYFGSSCMYPLNCEQPMKEEFILRAPLEPTNKGYALAKIAGSEVVQTVSQQDNVNWRVLILSNLYGPGDNFNAESSHLVAAIIRKVFEAKSKSIKEIEIWGSGRSRREFTHVDDVALFVSSNISDISRWEPVMNLGSGMDLTITEYYEVISQVMNFDCNFFYNLEKPDGMPMKLLDSTLARSHGWSPQISLESGLETTVGWFEKEALK